MEIKDFNPKSFLDRPEGKTGLIIGAGILGGLGYLLYKMLPTLITLAENTLYLGFLIAAIAAVVYMVIDPKVRNLVWFGYKSIMRWITGMFVQIDPIGILKSYVESLQDNLKDMNKQIGKLRGEMRKLKTIIDENQKNIKSNLKLASAAKDKGKQGQMILKSRKAGRLRESNMRLEDMYKKMQLLYRILTKMYENSEILLEDIQDQVKLKEQERKVIRASHGAMKSAMNIIDGKNDKRYMFDMALEAIAEDVGNKLGEMERFMEMSTNFMDSVDLQNGIFEEEGMEMLEKWEKESTSLLLGDQKDVLLLEASKDDRLIDIDMDEPIKLQNRKDHDNQYNQFFDF